MHPIEPDLKNFLGRAYPEPHSNKIAQHGFLPITIHSGNPPPPPPIMLAFSEKKISHYTTGGYRRTM